MEGCHNDFFADRISSRFPGRRAARSAACRAHMQLAAARVAAAPRRHVASQRLSCAAAALSPRAPLRLTRAPRRVRRVATAPAARSAAAIPKGLAISLDLAARRAESVSRSGHALQTPIEHGEAELFHVRSRRRCFGVVLRAPRADSEGCPAPLRASVRSSEST